MNKLITLVRSFVLSHKHQKMRIFKYFILKKTVQNTYGNLRLTFIIFYWNIQQIRKLYTHIHHIQNKSINENFLCLTNNIIVICFVLFDFWYFFVFVLLKMMSLRLGFSRLRECEMKCCESNSAENWKYILWAYNNHHTRIVVVV